MADGDSMERVRRLEAAWKAGAGGRVLLAPSVMCADWLHMGQDIYRLEEAGADLLHFDVVDGHFAPNLIFGLDQIHAIRKATDLPFDAHLMVVEAEPLLEGFARAGIQLLTFHPEVCEAPHRVIRRICELGMRAGIGLSPQAPPSLLNEFKRDIDLVIVMTIVPGVGGQRLIPEMIPRIAEVRELLASEGGRVLIAVDGQVSREVAPVMVRNGARILICGTASVFGHDPDAGVALESFRRDLEASLACSDP